MFNFSKDFRGAQCQFPATAYNPTKLGFNGGYNCSGSGRWLSLNPKNSGGGFHEFFKWINTMLDTMLTHGLLHTERKETSSHPIKSNDDCANPSSTDKSSLKQVK